MQWKGAEPELITSRLRLRAFRHRDAEDLLAIDSDPEVTYFRGISPMSAAESAASLRKGILRRRRITKNIMCWCVRSLDSDAFLGMTLLRDTSATWREMEVGYALARLAWGQGFGSEATFATLKFAFEQLNAHRVVANTYVENAGSRKILTKLGFREEAYQDESYFEHGEWQDNIQYALLDHEFKTNNLG